MGPEMTTVSLAFGAGFLSFFSPCILPMMPIYIMYLTGSTSTDQLNHKMVLKRSLGFVLGFTVVFMIMGLSASLIGRLFIEHRQFILKMSGFVMIVFGFLMLNFIKLPFLNKQRTYRIQKDIKGFFGAFIMGLAFAAGWTPCFGPVLASIVFYAGATSQGLLLLMVYSLGMAIPFLISAIFISGFNRFMKKFEKMTSYIPKFSGFILILFGLLILFNRLTYLNTLFF